MSFKQCIRSLFSGRQPCSVFALNMCLLEGLSVHTSELAAFTVSLSCRQTFIWVDAQFLLISEMKTGKEKKIAMKRNVS